MQYQMVPRARLRILFTAGLILGLANLAAAQSGSPNRLDSLLPADCLFYSGWNSSVTIDPSSGNHAEALIGEPEVQAFIKDLSSRMEKLIPALIPDSGDDRARIARRLAPSFARALLTRPGCVYLERLELSADGPPVVDGAFLLDVGADAASLADGFAKLTSDPSSPPADGVETSGGFSIHRLRIPDPNAPPVHFGAKDGMLFFAVGDQAVKSLTSRQDAGQPPEWLTKLQARNPLRKPTSYGLIDFAALRGQLMEVAPPEIARAIRELGLDALTQVESIGGFDEKGVASRVRIGFTGAPRGLLALNGESGIAFDELQHIPADALFATGISLDASRVLELVEKLLEQLSPNDMANFEEGFEEIKDELGVDLRSDIIASLGSTWTLYNGASDGLGTGLTLTVSVKDEEALSRAVDQFSQAAQSALARDGEAPKIVRQKMEGTDVYSLQFQSMPFPVEPSWCLAGNRLIVTLFPQSMAPLLKKLPHTPLVDDALYTRLSSPFGQTKAGNVIGFGYTDTRRQFELMYPSAQMMLTMMQGMGSELDLPPGLSEKFGPAIRGLSLPPARVIYPHLQPAMTAVRQTAEGFELETSQTLPMVDVTLAAPMAVGLLLPAIQQMRAAARRTQGANNLKQMALAVHNFESAFKRLPAAWTTDQEGKPLLSWRVQVLPFLDEQNLFEQFKQDEAWDSPHNIQLLEQMPQVFRSPSSQAAPGHTVYLGVGGVDGMFPVTGENGQTAKPTRFRDVRDGMSNTIMMIEASDGLAVPWTMPDPGFDPDAAELQQLNGQQPGGLSAAFADGSVQFLSYTLEIEMLKSFMKRNDGK